jgi:hypothetical protein
MTWVLNWSPTPSTRPYWTPTRGFATTLWIAPLDETLHELSIGSAGALFRADDAPKVTDDVL